MMRLRRRRADPNPDPTVVQAAEQTAAQVSNALEQLEAVYRRIQEPIMTLEQRFPAEYRKPQ